jgi:hypothetical protein
MLQFQEQKEELTSHFPINEVKKTGHQDVGHSHKVNDSVIDCLSSFTVRFAFHYRTAHGTLGFRDVRKNQYDEQYDEQSCFHGTLILIIRGNHDIHQNSCYGHVQPYRESILGPVPMAFKIIEIDL